MSNPTNSSIIVLETLRCLLQVANIEGKISEGEKIRDMISRIEDSGLTGNDANSIKSLTVEVFKGVNIKNRAKNRDTISALAKAFRDFVNSLKDPHVLRLITIEIILRISIEFFGRH